METAVQALAALVGGAFVGVLFALNALLKTLFRARKIGTIDLTLTLAVIVLFLLALVWNHAEPAAASALVSQGALGAATALAIFSVLIVILELVIRRQGLRGSRGMLGIWAALLIAVGTFVMPVVARQFDFVPPPITLYDAQGGEITEEPQTRTVQAEAFLNAATTVLADLTGRPEADVRAELEGGRPVAQFLNDANRPPEAALEPLIAAMRAEVLAAQERGALDRTQTTLALTGVERYVRQNLTLPLTQIVAQAAATDVPRPTATLTATRTPFPTNTPTLTRTPFPTPSPTLTRERFVFNTPTATVTLTPANPCLVQTLYNLRVRSTPAADAETLTTIPFETGVVASARTEDGAWYLVSYEGQQGWVDAAFVDAAAACADLPVQDA